MTLLDLSILTVSHKCFAVIRSGVTSLYAWPDRSNFETLLVDNTGADSTTAWPDFLPGFAAVNQSGYLPARELHEVHCDIA